VPYAVRAQATAPEPGPVTPQPGSATHSSDNGKGGVVSHHDADRKGGTTMLARPAHQDGHPVTRLLVVDDHAVVRQGLQQLFATVPGIDVVGVAADGSQAASQADRLRPDVVLMDIEMPNVDGVEATRRIISRNPTIRVVILSGCDDQARIRDALQAGAASYVPKYSDAGQVVRAVRDAAIGRAPSNPGDEPPPRTPAYPAVLPSAAT
jgi:CheY-like chemotaxis protein